MGLKPDTVAHGGVAIFVALTFGGFAGCLLVSPVQNLPFCALSAVGAPLLSARHISPREGYRAVRNLGTVVYLVHMIFIASLVYGVFGGRGQALAGYGVPIWAVFLLALGLSLALGGACYPFF